MARNLASWQSCSRPQVCAVHARAIPAYVATWPNYFFIALSAQATTAYARKVVGPRWPDYWISGPATPRDESIIHAPVSARMAGASCWDVRPPGKSQGFPEFRTYNLDAWRRPMEGGVAKIARLILQLELTATLSKRPRETRA